MELVFTLAVFLALALGLYLIFSPGAKSLSTKPKCLIFSAIIVIATLADLLSSPKA